MQGEVGGHRGCLSGVALSLASPQGQYRTVLYDSWVKQLTTHHVPHTSEPTLIGTLGNPVKIDQIQVCPSSTTPLPYPHQLFHGC